MNKRTNEKQTNGRTDHELTHKKESNAVTECKIETKRRFVETERITYNPLTP